MASSQELPADVRQWVDPPDVALLFRKGDRNDPRLGEAVRTEPRDYAASDVVLIGCPQDEGVRRNGGRVGSARAPDEIRRFLYRLTVNGIEGARMFDLGNTRTSGALEDVHDRHQRAVARVLRDGKRVIALGGGNDLSYPDGAALATLGSAIAAVNIDAHFDVRADAPRNSGTPYRMLIDQRLIDPAHFHELAYQPQVNASTYEAWLRGVGAHLRSLSEVRRAGAAACARDVLRAAPADHAVFVGIDLDAVRAADAPGVSAPNPLGLTGEEVCEMAETFGSDVRTRLVELTELNPTYDIDGRTARLAATVIWRVLAARPAPE